MHPVKGIATETPGVGQLARWPARNAVFDAQGRRWKLHAFLRAQAGGRVDTWVEVGTRWRLRLRLLAGRVPEAVAAVRRRRQLQRAQQSGRPVSAAQAERVGWMVRVTNAPADTLSLLEACVLARVRWQVEWVFRLGKSGGGLDQAAGHKPYRVLCALLAQLLGSVVQHGLLLTAGPPPWRQSQVRSAKRVRSAAEALARALRDVVALEQEWTRLRRQLGRVAGKQKRRGKPAAFQLIENPYNLEGEYLPAAYLDA